jgi:hypothetical protein
VGPPDQATQTSLCALWPMGGVGCLHAQRLLGSNTGSLCGAQEPGGAGEEWVVGGPGTGSCGVARGSGVEW